MIEQHRWRWARRAQVLLLGLLCSCAAWLPAAGLPPSALPGWGKDSLDGLAEAIQAQCRLADPPGHWRDSCNRRPATESGKFALSIWIEREFRAWPLLADDRSPNGLLTGYHEPLLTGSVARESAQQVPLLKYPDAPRTTALPSRAEIESGELPGQEPLVWLDDSVEAFFLHIQGSGRVQLRDGRQMRVGYAGNNGQTYQSIGRVLIDRGEMEADAVNADSIKAWLRAHQAKAGEIMQANPRYIFFRELTGIAPSEGPVGSLGVPLTAMRSLAADPQRVPPGSMLFVGSQTPDTLVSWHWLGLVQDTGAAIRGGVRADLFTGSDDRAARLAARLAQPMRAWMLLPRGIRPQ